MEETHQSIGRRSEINSYVAQYTKLHGAKYDNAITNGDIPVWNGDTIRIRLHFGVAPVIKTNNYNGVITTVNIEIIYFK